MELYSNTSFKCSKLITVSYSTSFSLGIKTLDKRFHEPIYGIYGFVRYADEIVDTFHDFDKKELLDKFSNDTFEAIKTGISLNPVLQSFQLVVNKYDISDELINAFLRSMSMDLYNQSYQHNLYNEYIYGSAEVVGLMCLKVFAEGDQQTYDSLKPYAQKLGAAFQKVNFLRDMKSDFQERGRVYFPNISFNQFTVHEKQKIENDIRKDFEEALIGIKQLPQGARKGVYLAYVYYWTLFRKIRNMPPAKILNERVRIPDNMKFILLLKSYIKHSF
ncbi:phytoene/squalene synthase family protein [Cytophagaceae bacterium ABcell3]|nr:phytoene/squalene synthase family protein [Cytophagaceae bacterium ABcell3]